MIMEGEGKGNLMGGNRLDFSVILMSSCLFQIILEGTDTLVYHRQGFIANLFNAQVLLLCIAKYILRNCRFTECSLECGVMV